MHNDNLKEKNPILNTSYSIRSSNGKFYLSNLNYKGIIFEPYILTREQYEIIRKLDGTKNLKSIIKKFKYPWKANLFLSELKKIKALRYSNKIRKFPLPFKKQGIFDVQFEFENKCNFNCMHCYQDKYLHIKKRDKLNLEHIKVLAANLEKLNAVKIALSGGEPFIGGDLKEICDIFKNRGIKPDCIFTNGLLINKKDIDWLSKESIHVFVSLDGITPNSHGIIRGVPIKDRKKVFNKIIRNVKELVHRGVIVKINTSLHRYNLNELDKMYSELKKIGVYVWRMTLPKLVGRYTENKNELYADKTKLSKSLVNLLKLFLKDVKKVKDGISVPIDLRIANVFKTEMLTKKMLKYSKNDSACDYQKERITIKSNGDVVPCGLLINHVYGNIKKEDLTKIWLKEDLQKIKNIPIKKILDCEECKYAYLCGGGCRVNSLYDYGDLFHKDKHACDCMKILFGPIKKLLENNGFKLKTTTNLNKKNHNKVYINNTSYSF